MIHQLPGYDLLKLADGFHDGVAGGETVPETDETGFGVDVGVEDGNGQAGFDGNRWKERLEVKHNSVRVSAFKIVHVTA